MSLEFVRARRYDSRPGWNLPLSLFVAQNRKPLTLSSRSLQALVRTLEHGLNALNQLESLELEGRHSAESESLVNNGMALMVEPLVPEMEMRDPYTAGHQARVAKIAVVIASTLGWNLEKVAGLRLGAQVLDLGRISIPSGLLAYHFLGRSPG